MTVPPRMIPAEALLDRVAIAAPTEERRRRLDKAYARMTGCRPRSLLRSLDRAEQRGEVSVKVADGVFAFVAMHEVCDRCGCWFPREGRNAWCCVCRRVPS